MEHELFIDLMKSCAACELTNHRSQVVVGDYSKKSGICFIGEAPGFNEDVQGRPFVGRSGKLLDQMLETIGLLREDVSVLNIVKCRPPDNRNPTRNEMNMCGSKWLTEQIEYLKPKLIVTLGSVPLKYFFPRKGMTKTKGQMLIIEKFGIPLIPFFHPSYILRNGNKLIDDYKGDFDLLRKYIETRDIINNLATNTANNSPQKSLDDFF